MTPSGRVSHTVACPPAKSPSPPATRSAWSPTRNAVAPAERPSSICGVTGGREGARAMAGPAGPLAHRRAGAQPIEVGVQPLLGADPAMVAQHQEEVAAGIEPAGGAQAAQQVLGLDHVEIGPLEATLEAAEGEQLPFQRLLRLRDGAD